MRAAVVGSSRRPRDGRRAPSGTRRSAGRPRRCPSARRPAPDPGRPGLREMERALHDARQILGAIDAVDALAERPVDLELVGVLVQVHFLVRMPAVVVRLHVAGDHDHRNRVERGVGDAGGRVGQPGSQVRQQHARLARGARVAVGRVRRHLLVARRDEADAALAERVEQADDRVAAQAEDDLDAEALEVVGQQIRRDARARRRWRRGSSVGCPMVCICVACATRRFRCCRTRRTAPARTAGLRESAG